MRTTLTVDDDLAGLLKERARELGIPFREMVNRALRQGLGEPGEPGRREVPKTIPQSFGSSGVLRLTRMGRTITQFPMGRFLAGLLFCVVTGVALCSGIASNAATTQVTKSGGISNPGGPAIKSPPQTGNFAEFLSAELIQWGGRENKLSEHSLPANWVTTRDRFGAAIDVTKGDYQALTNALTGEYGAPILYIKPTESRPATYLYVASKEGLRLFVKQESTELIEVTITRLSSQE